MKDIERMFGEIKAGANVPASEIFTQLAEAAMKAEKEGATLELSVALLIGETSMQIISNSQNARGTCFLHIMASSSIMQDIVFGG